MYFDFKRVRKEDIAILKNWFNKPHVKKWFGDSAEWIEEIQEAIGSHKQRFEAGHLIATLTGQPVGFAQFYDTSKASEGIWSSQPAGTVGIDFCIGEIEFVGKGFGRMLINSFVDLIIKEINPKRIIADPDLENKISISVLEKNEFQFDEESGLWIKDLQ